MENALGGTWRVTVLIGEQRCEEAFPGNGYPTAHLDIKDEPGNNLSMLKQYWNDPVWSKVIAGIILAVGALIGTYFLDWWPAIGRFAAGVYARKMGTF